MSYKLDLHTHSFGSPDGGLKAKDYKYFLENRLLDYIAVTDHNRIDVAQQLQAELGPQIIVGEEITTTKGELIGLYLKEAVPAGLTALQAAKAVHGQGGLVYVPHPFETMRGGLRATALNAIVDVIDIVEAKNGRAVFQNRSRAARTWAKQNSKPIVASSDAHGRFGWGYTYSVVEEVPTVKNLTRLLATAAYGTRTVGWGVLYPKYNRLWKSFGGTK